MDRSILFRYLVQSPQDFAAVIKIFGKRNSFPIPIMIFDELFSSCPFEQADKKSVIVMHDLFQRTPLLGTDYIRDTSPVLK